MENSRRKKLMETLKKFNKEQKEEVFTLGNEIKDLPVIASGVELFDNFIGGGFKKGAHTIIWSKKPSEGKTTLVLQTIAQAQRDGLFVCYVNDEKPIEPERFKFFGVNLDELVYIEAPSNAEKALEAMRRLCRDKVIDLFIVDSINGLCPKSVQETSRGAERSLEKKNVASLPLVLSNFYNIVNAYVFKSKAAIIWIGQGRTQGIGGMFAHVGLSGGNAQSFYAYQIVMLRSDEKSNAPQAKSKEYFVDPEGKIRYVTKKEPCGFGVVMKLTKTNSSKSARENSELRIPFLYDKGFVSEIVEAEDIPIEIDAKNDEEKKMIEEYLIEKKPEEAKKLGLIQKNPSQPLQIDQTSTDDIVPEEPKKRRGRPRKSKETL